MYPIKNKSDIKAVFSRFKPLVQKYFQLPLKVLCSKFSIQIMVVNMMLLNPTSLLKA